MKVGTLYDIARRYFPTLGPELFTQWYNMALSTLSVDYNISSTEEELTGSALEALPTNAFKIYRVVVDNVILDRLAK